MRAAQPWHWDNTKLLCCWIFPAAGYVARVLDFILSSTGTLNIFPVLTWPTKAPSSSSAAVQRGAKGSSSGGRAGAAAKSSASSKSASPAATCDAAATTTPPVFMLVSPSSPIASPVRGMGVLLALSLFVGLTLSGALGTWREMLNNAKTYDDADFDFADWISAHTPPDAIFMHDFVGQTNHIRPESSLAGRQTALGYMGWLSSHGLMATSWDRRAALTPVMAGRREAVAGLASQNISYIVIDPGSKKNFNYGFLDTFAEYEATSGKYSLWRVLKSVRTGAYKMRACTAGKPAGSVPTRSECLAGGCWHFAGAAPSEACVVPPRGLRNITDCREPGGPHFAGKDDCEDAGCVWLEGVPGLPYCQKARHQLEAKGRPAKVPTLRPGIRGSDCGGYCAVCVCVCVCNAYEAGHLGCITYNGMHV